MQAHSFRETLQKHPVSTQDIKDNSEVSNRAIIYYHILICSDKYDNLIHGRTSAFREESNRHLKLTCGNRMFRLKTSRV